MSAPGANIVYGDNNLGGTLANNDHVSAIFYALPLVDDSEAFPSMGEPFKFRTAAEAEAGGFDDSYAVEQNSTLPHQIREFFSKAKKGALLYVDLNTTETALTAAQVAQRCYDMQNYAEGEIRQFGIIAGTTPATAAAHTAQLQMRFAAMAAINRPAVALLSISNYWPLADSSPAALPTPVDADQRISYVVSYDNSLGEYADAVGVSGSAMPANIGRALGCLSAAEINENIGSTEDDTLGAKFDLSDGVAFLTVSFTGGKGLNEIDPVTDVDTVHAAGVIFARTYTGLPGVYWNSDPTRASGASDYRRLSRRRTMDKAGRLVYQRIVRTVNGRVQFKDGKLGAGYMAYLRSLANKAILQMVNDGEIVEGEVRVDPNQNVLADDNVNFYIDLVPYGTSERITGYLAFKPTLTA